MYLKYVHVVPHKLTDISDHLLGGIRLYSTQGSEWSMNHCGFSTSLADLQMVSHQFMTYMLFPEIFLDTWHTTIVCCCVVYWCQEEQHCLFVPPPPHFRESSTLKFHITILFFEQRTIEKVAYFGFLDKHVPSDLELDGLIIYYFTPYFGEAMSGNYWRFWCRDVWLWNKPSMPQYPSLWIPEI